MEGASAAQAGSPARAKALAARIAAVQALYQAGQNGQPVRAVAREYLDHRSAGPYGAAAPDTDPSEDRTVEPLLKAILVCGAFELLMQQVDAPVIINDYLDVGHAFYQRNEVALINGVLDSIAAVFQ